MPVMCGRYIATTPPEELRRLFGTVNDLPNWEPTWNMAPSQLGPVVRLHPGTGARHLDLLRWGLLPHWARGDPRKIRQPINARAETVATLPTFRDAFARRRCIVPIDGFYEWQVLTDGKQPHAVARADGAVMALAERVLVLHHGTAIAEGSPDAVVREPAVVESYLGAEAVD